MVLHSFDTGRNKGVKAVLKFSPGDFDTDEDTGNTAEYFFEDKNLLY